MKLPRKGWAIALGALCGASAAGIAYATRVRPWMRRWGATDEELSRCWPGDEYVAEPNHQATLGVTIHAPPSDVWPWLMQLGRGRGGLYSYDWLDRLFGVLDRDSAQTLLPDVRELAPGDAVPVGFDPGAYLPVLAVEKPRALVLGAEGPAGMRWSWSFLLEPVDGEATRLVSRSRALVPDSLRARATMGWLEPATFLMTRRMLMGIRDLAQKQSRCEALSVLDALAT